VGGEWNFDGRDKGERRDEAAFIGPPLRLGRLTRKRLIIEERDLGAKRTDEKSRKR